MKNQKYHYPPPLITLLVLLAATAMLVLGFAMGKDAALLGIRQPSSEKVNIISVNGNVARTDSDGFRTVRIVLSSGQTLSNLTTRFEATNLRANATRTFTARLLGAQREVLAQQSIQQGNGSGEINLAVTDFTNLLSKAKKSYDKEARGTINEFNLTVEKTPAQATQVEGVRLRIVIKP